MFKSILFTFSILFSLTLTVNSQWKTINSTIGADIKSLVKINDGLLVATDGKGIYYSPNSENNWSQKNSGLNNLKVYCLDVANLYIGIFFIKLQMGSQNIIANKCNKII